MGKNLLLIIGLILLASCSQKNQSVQSQIQDSIDLAQEAKSLSAWKTSSANPSNLFDRVRESQDLQERKELCKGLSSLETKKLLVFEEEIAETENHEVLEDCLLLITSKIEDHYEAQRAEMAAAGMATVEFVSQDRFSQAASGIWEEELDAIPQKRQALRKKSASPSYGDAVIINEGRLQRPRFRTQVNPLDLSKGWLGITGDVKDRQVILTFDDGPHETYTTAVLTALREVNAKAIFFQQGMHVDQYPELTRAVGADGHAVGSHTYDHNFLGSIDQCGSDKCRRNWRGGQDALAQIRRAHQSIYDALGWIDPFFRFPYGAQNKELRQFLVENQIGEFFWNVDSNDWSTSLTPTEVLNQTLEQLDKQGKGIVLFHDVQRKTVEILPQFLRELGARGYQPVILRSTDPKARTNSKIVNLRGSGRR